MKYEYYNPDDPKNQNPPNESDALQGHYEAEREAERDVEFGPEKDLVLEGISQLNKLANFKLSKEIE